MTDTTPRMALQELVASQAQKHVTVNDDLIALDAMMGMYVKGNGTNAPPGSPSDGDTYIVGSSPTGDWSGCAGKIAYCIDGGWRFYTPFDGLQAYDATASSFIIYDGGDWLDDVVTTTGTQTLSNKTFSGATSFPIGTIIGATGHINIGTDWSGSASLSSSASSATAISGDISTAGRALLLRTNNAAANLIDFYYVPSTMVGSVSTNGTSVAYNTTSDARLKNVCAAQGDYRAAIKALWVGDFIWKESGAKGFGVLAQQAWKVMPHHQGVTRPADDEGQWHASAEPFGHLALWGVKDLYAAIAALEARIQALEAK